MDPFRNDPFSPFADGGAFGDPMEEVLALQSYSVSAAGVRECGSWESQIICASGTSCASQQSSGELQLEAV